MTTPAPLPADLVARLAAALARVLVADVHQRSLLSADVIVSDADPAKVGRRADLDAWLTSREAR